MEETYVNCRTYTQVADVIRNMVVRVRRPLRSRAMGIALGVKNSKAENGGDLSRSSTRFATLLARPGLRPSIFSGRSAACGRSSNSCECGR